MSAQHIYKLLHLFFGTAHALKEESNREARSCRGFATVKIHFFFYPSRNSSSPIIQTSLSRRKSTLFYIATHLPCKGWWKVYLEAGRSAQAQQYHSTEGTCSRNAYHVYKHQCENSHGHDSLWLKMWKHKVPAWIIPGTVINAVDMRNSISSVNKQVVDIFIQEVVSSVLSGFES